MDAETIEQELAAGWELLEKTMCRLAYNGRDGLPRVIPIAFFWTGSEIVMSTTPNAPTVAALRERPEVAFVVDSGDSPDSARSLSVRGTARIDIVDGVTDEYIAAAYRSYDAEQAAEFEKSVRELYDQQARFYDFDAGRMPKFLTDLVQEKSG